MKRRKPELIEMDETEFKAILERAQTGQFTTRDCEKLQAVYETLSWVMRELEEKNASLARLRKSLSINTKKTEKTSDVLKEEGAQAPAGEKTRKKKKKPKGHGRNGASAYEGAEKTKVPHPSLKPGDSCPACEKGKVYEQNPQRLVRLRGQAPIPAKLWELERLRCNLCGEVFTAPAPAEVGEKKYDETSASMIGLLKYGSGLPFNRIARLEEAFGIPLPASTQWDLVHEAFPKLTPAYQELIRTGAQGDIFHLDDTSVKILELLKENRQIELQGSSERTGIFTTGAVLIWKRRKIALFFTGRQHTGENLKDLLEKRASELDPPIYMCDGSSRNEPEGIDTITVNCLLHGRRKFVEVTESFPRECRQVLESLRKIYKNDATTRKRKMSPEKRLSFHKDHSTKLMDELRDLMNKQLTEREVEPNSSLGQAYSYMLNRWDKLTLFLRKPGAPLDNNVCERALKKAILHRKNALFYKTENGARVGDTYMSLIYTAELNSANPFDYLTELQKHADQVRGAPQDWMPWNYRAALTAQGDLAADDRSRL